MTYKAPLDDLWIALEVGAGLGQSIDSGLYQGVDRDLVRSVLEAAARFAEAEIAPLDRVGDETGLTLKEGHVTVPPGWTEVYRRWAEAGWSALPCPTDWGGQGLPNTVAMAVSEMWNSAALSFGLGPVLTQGAIEAMHHAASDELKHTYLPKMVDGTWAGTMNLTESQAGTDLGALKTRAVPQADGTYRIFGTKVFISYGEHEMTENIIHLVLAKLPDAPSGTRGISLFVVPKYLLDKDGRPGTRNDVRCTGLEEKLGIHGSPTCVMTYGEKAGAVGYIVGEPNRGLNAMFVMMNRARLAVGVQGVAVAERALQKAMAYAQERRQGRAEGAAEGVSSPIIEHPDVKRMLMTMRALTQASRMICQATAVEIDRSERAADPAERARAANRAALLTPIAKSFSTDCGVEVASLGIQVHGGTGFIETTGAAQHYRDARILPIYEGTNGVQAIDLVMRKLPLEAGAVVKGYLGELAETARAVKGANAPDLGKTGEVLGEAVKALDEATQWIGLALQQGRREEVLAVATPYQRLFGIVAGGAYLARAALAREADGRRGDRIRLSRFFAETIAITALGLARAVTESAGSVLGAEVA
jgi:alkylation response protein AidB-like acyl-CoA dehydrogenase